MRIKIVACLFALCGSASVAWALPQVPKYLQEAVSDKPEFEAYGKSLAGAKDKCASCHQPGGDKKAKGHALNDFGQAFHKHFDDKAFKAAAKDKDDAKAKAIVEGALSKSLDGEKGKGFADRMKAGELPGTNK